MVSDLKMKEKLLEALHDAPLVGHLGFYESYRVMKERFYWKGLKEDVLRHVRECATCQQNKHENTHLAGPLQPLPISHHKWKGISMDFITSLLKTQGKDNIFVAVDRLTKYAHFFAITVTITTTQLVDIFFKEVFRLHGLPKTIVHDRDNKCMSNFW